MGVKIYEYGERPCRKCDKPHDCVRVVRDGQSYRSWADPTDGHAYHPVSWEEMYRKAVAA